MIILPYLSFRIRRKLKPEKGFSLIEIIVVVTIFSIIALAVGSSFISGMKLWNRAKDADFPKYELFLSLESIARDFRQSVSVTGVLFEGTSEEVSFPTLVGDSIVKVTYKFDPQEKTLLRREVGLKDVLSETAKENAKERQILSLEELTFSYLCKDMEKNTYIWIDTWEKGKGIFIAIKLKGRLKDNEFTKTVFIPIS